MKAPENATELKRSLYDSLSRGELTLGQATRSMRKIVGMTQKEYAKKVVGLTPRILADIENDKGNPRLETLQKIGRPFGLTVRFVTMKRNSD